MHIIVALDSRYAFGRRAMEGIREYALTQKDWQLQWVHPQDSEMPHYLDRCDGLIHSQGDASFPAHLRKRNVRVTGGRGRGLNPAVLTDYLAIGRMGARYLLDSGFQRFGFLGDDRLEFSKMRAMGFTQELEESGYHPSVCNLVKAHENQVLEWLRGFRPPFAVMTMNDHFAMNLSHWALAAGIAIPEEMTILGVDNDDVLCAFGAVPLSSIDPNLFGVGFRAAQMLNDLLVGKKLASPILSLPPSRVVERQSVDIFAVEHKEVRKALRYIRENVFQGISVDEVVHQVAMNRRNLEKAFRKHLHKTIHDEISRLRIRKAKELLSESRLPIAEIVEECGFTYPSQFANAFRKATGQSPSDFRKQWFALRAGFASC
ncbi:MAG: substrate-binding domain-containing protein [Opitutales bacterium]|nr:substrate-binding domain-containing protein [Opitutales bacterium]